MDDIEVKGTMGGTELELNLDSSEDAPMFIKTDKEIESKWDFINVSTTNSMKFGTGISLTYAYKNSFSWRVFCDYDYSSKTYTATYSPFGFFNDLSPEFVVLTSLCDWDLTQAMTSSAQKHLHQWVLGGALCVSF